MPSVGDRWSGGGWCSGGSGSCRGSGGGVVLQSATGLQLLALVGVAAAFLVVVGVVVVGAVVAVAVVVVVVDVVVAVAWRCVWCSVLG